MSCRDNLSNYFDTQRHMLATIPKFSWDCNWNFSCLNWIATTFHALWKWEWPIWLLSVISSLFLYVCVCLQLESWEESIYILQCFWDYLNIWNSIFCRYVDQGRNPQLYTKDCMERAVIKNEHVKGKIEAFKVKLKLVIKFELDIISPIFVLKINKCWDSYHIRGCRRYIKYYDV